MSQSLTLKQSTPETFGTQWESNYLMPYHARTRGPQNSSRLVQRKWKYSPCTPHRCAAPPCPVARRLLAHHHGDRPCRSHGASPPRPAASSPATTEIGRAIAAPAGPHPHATAAPAGVPRHRAAVSCHRAAQPRLTSRKQGGTEGNDAAPVAGGTESRSARADALNLTQGNPEKQPDLFAMSPRVLPASGGDLATQKEKTSSESLLALLSESKSPPKCSDYSQLTDWHEIRRQICKDESLSLLAKPVIASQQPSSPKTWVPIPTLEIKELRRAVRYSGICSPYLKQLLKSTLKGTHQTLKHILNQQKGGEAQATPQRRLNKALYVYNFLSSSAEEPDPPIYRHFLNKKKAKLKEHPQF
ncbi:uncharacterized protein LOC120410184 [Corvus cornix cornix]|uniref:uncharacterized protein LOC120410184 n=1 Tax=Corvus cornix cornix TaxID=932674 RepID=UPI00194E642B|nr:uncharacterized protein LOC120410184 [Corvus cornix cornix]